MAKKAESTKNKKFATVREKLEFVHKHCREPELFEDLKQLFRKKGFKDVVIEHGNSEYGKDLVFSLHDAAFDEKKWYAAIVKNKNASQNDFVAGGEIMQQIELASRHPYINAKGTPYDISGLFIIINGAVSFNAKHVMQKFIDPVLLPHIQIWDYQKLSGEIETHIKELYLDKLEPTINVFTKAQITQLSDLRSTNNLFDLQISEIDDIFVNVQTSYTKALKRVDEYVSFENGKKEKRVYEDIDGTNEILASHNNFIIHGIPTCGKSLLLRRIGIKALKDKSGKPDAVFFFEFPKIISSSKTLDIALLMRDQYSELTGGEKFNVEEFDRVHILFDSIDEINSLEHKVDIIRQVDHFVSKASDNYQVIFTIRNTELLDKEKLLQDFEKTELLPFNVGQALRLVNKIIPDDKTKSSAFVNALKDSLLTSGLLRTPLALTLMAILYRDNNIDLKELPANITELYNKFVDTYLDRWDVSKGISRQYQYDQTKIVLALIAVHLNIKGSVYISDADLRIFLNELKTEYNYDVLDNVDEFIDHLKYRNGVFNYDNGQGSFSFYNHYFQEYFVSIGIDDSNEEVLTENFFSEWWESAIVFYCGKNPRRDKFLKGVAKNILPLTTADRYLYIQLLSKGLQASHAISINSRLAIVKKLLNEFDSFYVSVLEDGKRGENVAAFQSTMTLIMNFRDLFEKLFSSKHVTTKETLQFFEETLLDVNTSLTDVTRYCVAYFVSSLQDTPHALEIFASDGDLEIIWNRIIYVDLNFFRFKKKVDKATYLRVKRKMSRHKFNIIHRMKSVGVKTLLDSDNESDGDH